MNISLEERTNSIGVTRAYIHQNKVTKSRLRNEGFYRSLDGGN